MKDTKILATVHDNGAIIISFKANKDMMVLEFTLPYSDETALDGSTYKSYNNCILYKYDDGLLSKIRPGMFDYVNALADIIGYNLIPKDNTNGL